MINYAYGRECRQRIILRYFGDPAAADCGACDRCTRDRSKSVREPSDEERLTVRKLLSGVARMSHRTEKVFLPRFDLSRMIQVLLASKSRAVSDAQLHRPSTYALLKYRS